MRPVEVMSALVAPHGRRDPYPLYEALRAHGNLLAIKPGLMVAVGYRECTRVLREPRLRVQDAASYDAIHPGWRKHASLRGYTDSMLYRNPPDHGRIRRLVSGEFTPRRVAALRPAIARMTDRLLDNLAVLGGDGSAVDFIAEFASRLPIAVISELLGVPEHDQVWFRAVAADITIALEGITGVDRLGPADAAMDELGEYFTALVGRRRRCPAEDLLSALVRTHDTDGERLTHQELLGNLMLMLTAGFETTSFLLGHALLLAFAHPHHAARLRAVDHSTIPTVDDASAYGFAAGYVEEVLRFEPPVQATSRWAEVDVPLLDTMIPAGTKIVAILAAGNRDPRRYEDPQRFDPDRTDVQPLDFGAGAHFCLGAPLARMEARIALPRLLRRFPALAPAGTPARRDTWVGRGIDHFPITLK